MSDVGTPIDVPANTIFKPDASQSPLVLCVVPFRLAAGELEVGTLMHEGHRVLPGGDPALEETLDDGARRIIHQNSNRSVEYLEQLYTFSLSAGPWRQIVIGYIALFRDVTSPGREEASRLIWRPVRVAQLDRPIDCALLDYAVVRLRAKLGYTNIAFHLMPPTFTLTELQQAYETVLGHEVDKRNFRRRMSVTGILADTGEKRRDGSHRPAALYRFASRDDQAAYLTPPWASERLLPETGDTE